MFASINTEALISTAVMLLADPGDRNDEYERALVELVTFTLGGDSDDREDVRSGLLATRGDSSHADWPYCDLCGEGRVFFRRGPIGVCSEHVLVEGGA